MHAGGVLCTAFAARAARARLDQKSGVCRPSPKRIVRSSMRSDRAQLHEICPCPSGEKSQPEGHRGLFCSRCQLLGTSRGRNTSRGTGPATCRATLNNNLFFCSENGFLLLVSTLSKVHSLPTSRQRTRILQWRFGCCVRKLNQSSGKIAAASRGRRTRCRG